MGPTRVSDGGVCTATGQLTRACRRRRARRSRSGQKPFRARPPRLKRIVRLADRRMIAVLKGKWLGVTLGASSGAVWFLIALAFDKGVRDFNYPVIPTASPLAIALSLFAAILTGVAISLL